jgi:DNA-binding beta-propeller fold protein YncE
MKRAVCIGASVVALLAAAGIGPSRLAKTLAAQGRGAAQAPTLDVDLLWPKPFPVAKHWILGSVTGVAVDGQDRVWVVHRGVDSLQTNEKGPALEPWASMCCFAAPQVLAFDAAGTLVANWEPKSGSGYDWPVNPSGIAVDDKGNVWIGSGLPTPSLAPAGRGARGAPAAGARGAAAPGADAARGGAAAPAAGRGAAPAAPPAPADAQVLKFSRDGKFLLQIGKAGKTEGSDSPTGFNRPGALAVDSAANELYVADGFGNHRIAVFDANTGAFKRSWGAYGEKPTDTDPGPYDPNAAPSKQFHTLSCVKIAKDGMVYVCDRQNDRVQVFAKDGKFVKEAFVSKTTTGDGSVWDVAFSSDPQQRILYVADGHDKKVWMLDRSSLETIGSFGDGGRNPGRFYGVGSVAVDSKGNVYTGETYEGKRVQKFVNKGR